MSIKKIGTPRPPKEGAIKFQFGRHEGSHDFLVLYGNDVPRCDRALVMHLFTSPTMEFNYEKRIPEFGDSFIEELDKRGYDTKTIKFYVERKEN